MTMIMLTNLILATMREIDIDSVCTCFPSVSLQSGLEEQHRTELEIVQRQSEREREEWRRERQQLQSKTEKEVHTHSIEPE